MFSINHIIPAKDADGMDLVNHVNDPLTRCNSGKKDTARLYATDILAIVDRRGDYPKFKQAKIKELTGLRTNGVFEVVSRKDILREANILGGRFALIKNKGTKEEVYK